MKEQHFQKLEVFHVFYLLIFSYTCKNEQNLKASETPALAILSHSVQQVFPFKGFFLCKEASKSGRKLQFTSCLVIIQAIHLPLFMPKLKKIWLNFLISDCSRGPVLLLL